MIATRCSALAFTQSPAFVASEIADSVVSSAVAAVGFGIFVAVERRVGVTVGVASTRVDVGVIEELIVLELSTDIDHIE